MAKLQNIKALKEMIAGKHKFQNKTTVGYRKKKEHKLREVGDIWEETLPNGSVIEWEQKSGYRHRRQKNLKSLHKLSEEIYDFPNCYDNCEKKETKNYNQYDRNAKVIHGMCLDCLSRYETELKVKGEFENYRKEKEKQSMISFLKEAEQEKEGIKELLQGAEFVEEDGSVEKWAMTNKKELLEKVDSDFEKFKKRMMHPYLSEEE